MTVNPERGETMIRLGGKEYRLRPTFAAVVAIRNETGEPLGATWARLSGLDLVAGATVIAAVLRANGEALTTEQVGEMLVAGDAGAAMNAAEVLLRNILTAGVEAGALGEGKAATERTTEKSPSAASSA